MRNLIPSHGRTLAVLAIVALIASYAFADAQAGHRWSRVKEIVVVGSVVTEAVEAAELSIEFRAIHRLSGRVKYNLYAAMYRAARNDRRELLPMDLNCPVAPDDADLRMNKADLIESMATRRGYTLGEGFEAALNAQTNQLVAEAVTRAKGNNRSTVRPYDL